MALKYHVPFIGMPYEVWQAGPVASDLFLETCKKDSLWYRAAVRTGLLETFNRQECNNSDLQINFAEVMSDSSAEVYCESLNIRQTANLLNVEFYV